MSPTAAAVQGACPSVHRPFHQLDGELLRVRVPGGRVTAEQAVALAELGAALGATLELTGRANLQLRGLDAGVVSLAVTQLIEVGLVHPDPRLDERRNLMAAPAAGFDPGETMDVGPLVRLLDEVLIGQPTTEVPPTFGVLLDGGGRINLRGRPRDVAFGAVRTAGGAVAFEVRVGDGLPAAYGSGERIPLVRTEDLRIVLTELLEGTADIFARSPVEWVPAHELVPPPAPTTGPPLGILPQHGAETVALGVMPVLGRLVPTGWERLARLAADHGRGELRLSPWRSVLVPGIPRGAAGALIEDLESAGFVVSGEDPAAGVVCCIGSRGCPAALTDALADARTVIETLRREGRRLSVHVSGCEKRCAGRRSEEHELTLIGGPKVGSYRRSGGEGGAIPAEVIDEQLHP